MRGAGIGPFSLQSLSLKRFWSHWFSFHLLTLWSMTPPSLSDNNSKHSSFHTHYSMLNFQQAKIYMYLKKWNLRKWNRLGGFICMGFRRDFELKQKTIFFPIKKYISINRTCIYKQHKMDSKGISARFYNGNITSSSFVIYMHLQSPFNEAVYL